MAQLHAPVQRGDAAIAGRLVEHRITLDRGGKRLRVAFLVDFEGELRATGQVLRDQFVFMLRAGFDTFEVKKVSDAEAFALTAKRYSVFYQPTGDGRVTALNRRMQLRHSESAGQ